jgi:hypothetical protein
MDKPQLRNTYIYARRKENLDPDIDSMYLDHVSVLIAIEEDWSLQKIDRIEIEYRCFWQVIRRHPDMLIVPTLDIDRYWHAHILCLRSYLDDCQRIFGYPLIHWPFSGRFGGADAVRQHQLITESRPLLVELVNRVLPHS